MLRRSLPLACILLTLLPNALAQEAPRGVISQEKPRVITSWQELNEVQHAFVGAADPDIASKVQAEHAREGYPDQEIGDLRRPGPLADSQVLMDEHHRKARAAGFTNAEEYNRAVLDFYRSQLARYQEEIDLQGVEEAGRRNYRRQFHEDIYGPGHAEEQMSMRDALELETILESFLIPITEAEINICLWRMRGRMYELHSDSTYIENIDWVNECIEAEL